MKLTLYQFEQCPFCAKVRATLEKQGVAYEKVNVSPFRDAEDRIQLHEQSGVWTVPVLKFEQDGAAKYISESDAIIAWLEKE